MDKWGFVFALLTVLTVMTGAWFIAGVYYSMTAENIGYEVIDELDDGVEIRRYGEMTVVSTAANGQNEAFSLLARYISGNNRDNVRMNMTSPVISIKDDSSVSMSFVLPEGYDAENAPLPEKSGVAISTIPPRKLAVITFSGYANDNAFDDHRSVLSSQLEEHGIVTKGDFFLMRYNPPWVPPSLMRNEVAVEVE
ncbi:SOUL family heme-binding protein [Methanolobus sp. WCC5]|uniref:SOUL family heme-binding protein n=1 Tax=Methanolobus sp. WCC5 TaxID=3125785 RepID=UPI00324D2603